MKYKLLLLSVMLFAICCWLAPAMAAEVCQGKCIAYNQAEKTITLEEYNTNITHQAPYGEPTGIMLNYNVATALMGIPPEPGDILRIAYEVKGPERVALKIMNVSKQDLRKK